MWFRYTLAAMAMSLGLAAADLASGIERKDIDPACKPCDDFWRYANGGWVDRNPIPNRYSSWGSFVVLEEQNLAKLRSVLEEAAKDATAAKGSNTQKLGAYYGACMDTAAMDRRGWDPIKPDFARIDKAATIRELGSEIARLQEPGVSAPFRFFADADFKDSARNIVMIAIGGLSLPEREYYFKTDDKSKSIREEFLKHVGKMIELTGVPADRAAADAAAILAFETKLAEARMTIVDRRNPEKTYDKVDLAGLSTMAPSFAWKAALDSSRVALEVPINVTDSGALKGFEARLKDTPLPLWKTYLKWRLLNAAADSLSQPFRDQDFTSIERYFPE